MLKGLKMHSSLSSFFTMSLFALLLTLVSGMSPVAIASSPHDHEKARTAFEKGEIKPLSFILDIAAKDYPGDVLEVELENENKKWIYEIKILTKNNVLQKVKIDAKNGSVITVKSKPKK
jgi:uncharacterized membrane protein YkoI